MYIVETRTLSSLRFKGWFLSPNFSDFLHLMSTEKRLFVMNSNSL